MVRGESRNVKGALNAARGAFQSSSYRALVSLRTVTVITFASVTSQRDLLLALGAQELLIQQSHMTILLLETKRQSERLLREQELVFQSLGDSCAMSCARNSRHASCVHCTTFFALFGMHFALKPPLEMVRMPGRLMLQDASAE